MTVDEEVGLIAYVIISVFIYGILFLGAFSPIHCRMTLTISGLMTVFGSVYAGFGLCAMLGFKTDIFHDSLYVLLMGIGIDDMFVICNALDQTPLHLPADKRLKLALKHAGPSITITSLTNALAFFSGAISIIPSLASFSFYCAISVLVLYFSVLTIFLPMVYWDTLRVSKRYGDCFGLFFCKEDSVLFCRGQLLPKPMRNFSFGR